MFDGTAIACQELIRFLGMAFWADSFPPDASSNEPFSRETRIPKLRHLRALDITHRSMIPANGTQKPELGRKIHMAIASPDRLQPHHLVNVG
jgi:hypothetical protein